MRLILVRHGQTPSNVKHLLDTGEPGPGLTELGREQAAAVPAALRGTEIDAIYVSNLVRTHETAAPLAAERGLVPRERAGLREIDAGDLEMRGDREAVEVYLHAVASWVAGDLDLRVPGGEDGHEVLGRFDAVVREMEEAALGSVVVVSHGAVLRTWSGSRSSNISAQYVAANVLGNTGVIVVEGSFAEGWRCLAWEGDSLGGASVESPVDGPAGEAL